MGKGGREGRGQGALRLSKKFSAKTAPFGKESSDWAASRCGSNMSTRPCDASGCRFLPPTSPLAAFRIESHDHAQSDITLCYGPKSLT